MCKTDHPKTTLRQWIARFSANSRGSVAIIFSAAIPVLFLFAGVSIDYGLMSVRKARLQNSADSAALAAAHEYPLANSDATQIQSVAYNYAMSNLGANAKGLSITTLVSSDPPSVTVTITQTPALFFAGKLLGIESGAIFARAVAVINGGVSVCVLGLEAIDSGTITLEKNAKMTANECAVYSNSSHANGIKSKDNATVTAELICSAGGLSGSKSSFDPNVITDCPPLEDPLKDRPAPSFGACTENNHVVDNETVTLSPGVYCSGLTITNNAHVTLMPGIYVIRNGMLVVEDGAELVGIGVGFYMSGTKALFRFATDSHISLAAPRTGTMAGLLFFESRKAKAYQKHEIYSDDARLLLGTIYLPQGSLYIAANKPVADQSAYTAIVARTVELSEGPDLVLNSDYGATEVPVPEGLGGAVREVALAK